MKSKLFSLAKSDLIKGALSAAFSAAIMALATIVSAKGFSVFHVDWAMILDITISSAISTFLGVVTHSFMTDSEGVLLGSADLRD